MFELYSSEHLYGFGRFFVIITKTEHRFGIISEIYLFGSSVEGPIFDGIVIKLPAELVSRDLEFVNREAMMQAENMAQRCQYEVYKRSKDRDLIINNSVNFHKVQNDTLISIKQTPEHAEHLLGIAEDTKSEELSKYIQDIFPYSFKVRPYKKGDE
jgi:hypothetical protein